MSIMKQLIEQMVGDYLNESYEDDLIESIFEEVSEETWEAIQEAILNELSPELIARYKKKATKSYLDTDKYSDKAKAARKLSSLGAKGMIPAFGDPRKTSKQIETGKQKMDAAAAQLKSLEKTNLKRNTGIDAARRKYDNMSGDDKIRHDILDLDAAEFKRRHRITKAAAKEKLSK